MDDLVTPRQAAAIIGISPSQVWYEESRGRLTAARVDHGTRGSRTVWFRRADCEALSRRGATCPRATCRVCGDDKPLTEFPIRDTGEVDTLCFRCTQIMLQVRDGLPLDPCPICGVAAAAHWSCQRCGSRGHALRRGTGTLCQDCEAEYGKAPPVRP